MAVVPVGGEGQAQSQYAPSALPPVDPAAGSAKPYMLNNAAAPERSGLPLVSTATLASASAAGSVAGAAVGAGAAAQSPAASTLVAQQTPAAAASSAGAAAQDVASRRADAVARSATQSAQTAAAQEAARARPSVRFPGQLPPAYKSETEKALEKQINDLVPNLWKASGAAVDVLIGADAMAAAAARAAALANSASAAATDAASKGDGVRSYSTQSALADGKQNPPAGSVFSAEA